MLTETYLEKLIKLRIVEQRKCRICKQSFYAKVDSSHRIKAATNVRRADCVTCSRNCSREYNRR